MSATKLRRDYGVIIRCDGTDMTNCSAMVQTGNVIVKHNRTYAKSLGWGRGLRTGYKRRDLCPPHLAIEKQLLKEQQERGKALQKARDENRKIKLSPEPPKRPRKRKASASIMTDSPSADSVPAPAS